MIGHTLKGAMRTTYLRVTFPFAAASRILYRGARGIVLAVCRVFAATRDGIVAGIQLTGRGIRRAIHATGRMLYQGARGIVLAIERVYNTIKDGLAAGILATGRGIRRTVLGIGSASALVFRSVINMATKALRDVSAGILSVGRAIPRSMGWTRHLIAARLAATTDAVIHRAAGNSARRVGIFIGARYRAFIFRLASTTMTLSLEDGHARLLVLRGNQIVAWRSGQIAEPPEEPAAVPEAGTKPEERAKAPVFNPLGSLLEGLPAHSKQVITDLPLYVPLLRHIPIPDVKGRFLNEIITAEVLDSVPFAQDGVDILWRIEQGDDIKEASVIAVPRDRMNVQVRMVRDSQLAPSAVYSKAASLATAVARPDVFILHMTKARTAVVLVRGGVPRIVHQLDLRGDTTEQAEAIAMGVGQVAGYHRSQRPDDDVGDLPVVVTGEVDQVRELVGLLATTLDRPVHPFEPSLECPEGFDPAEYASNIGLFLASRSKKSAKLIAAQNVLPERHQPRAITLLPPAVFAGLLALLFVAFNLTESVSAVAGELGLLDARLDIREDQAREYRLSVASQSVIDQRIVDVDLEALDLEANLLSLEQEMNILLSRISDITGNAGSSNVALSRIVPIPEGFSVSGTTDSYSGVLGYAALMRSSPNFEDAAVIQVADSTGESLAFTVVVTISTPESEETYQAPSGGGDASPAAALFGIIAGGVTVMSVAIVIDVKRRRRRLP